MELSVYISNERIEIVAGTGSKSKAKIKKVYSKCNVLIALSEEWKERLSQIVPEDRIEIIENYSVLHEDALEGRMHRECNNTVLFLGELGKRKGCYDIPAVIAQVKKSIPDVKFVLAGAGNEFDENAIKKLIDEKGVSDNVEFPGWVRGDMKDKLLRKADVFFLPSYNEGMPMSVLDAMGYGLPVVSTNVGGIPKIVHDGENGYCCDPGDVNRFGKGITKILLDEKERKSFGEASWKIVKEGYSLEAHLNRIEQAYEQVLLMDI